MEKAHQTLVLVRDSVNPERAERFIESLNRYADDAVLGFVDNDPSRGVDFDRCPIEIRSAYTTIKADVATVRGSEIVEGLILDGDVQEASYPDAWLHQYGKDLGYAMVMVVA